VDGPIETHKGTSFYNLASDHFVGPADGRRSTVVEFSIYRCGFCKRSVRY